MGPIKHLYSLYKLKIFITAGSSAVIANTSVNMLFESYNEYHPVKTMKENCSAMISGSIKHSSI